MTSKELSSDATTISPLADFPGAIATLAQWFYHEWHALDGRSPEFIAVQLSENLNRDRVPITFLAHRNAELLGSVSLDFSDLPPFDHFSPWLASLYVHPQFRGQGIGSSLICHLVRFAASRRINPLYLWTPGATKLYERCGWVEFVSATYANKPIKLMRFSSNVIRKHISEDELSREG
jgi:GNAT superfamily N-acetyltransferase